MTTGVDLLTLQGLLDGVVRFAALPTWLGFGLLMEASLVTALTGIMVSRAIFPARNLLENVEVGGFKFAFLAQTVAAFMLLPLLDGGPITFQAWKHVRAEGEALEHFLEITDTLPENNSELIRSAVHRYIHIVVDKEEGEWNSMAHGQARQAASNALVDVYAAFLRAPTTTPNYPTVQERALGFFNQALEHRSARLNAAQDDLKPLVWAFLLVISTVSLIMIASFGNASVWLLIGMAWLLVTAQISIMYLAIKAGQPYVGDFAASMQPFEQIIGM